MNASPHPPRLPYLLLKLLLPAAEREEILADVRVEHASIRAADGATAANRWVWQQAIQSAPALLRWSGWRSMSGFEPSANNYRPGGPMLKHISSDVRFAARRLIARPAYSVLAILTLALGIGGTTAIFGVARPLILDPLPYGNDGRIAAFWFAGSWTEAEFTFLRDKFPGYKRVATFRSDDVTMREGSSPTRLIPAIATSTELFDVLGTRPFMGNGFAKGDDAIGAAPVAVLSYGLWQELGAKPDIIGSRLTLDGTPRTITGVMPRGFWFPNPMVRVWYPQPINPEGQNGSFQLVGEVADGLDPEHMEPQTAALANLLRERFTYSSEWDKTKNPGVKPLRDDLLGTLRPALIATFAGMALILLIACTNVAALMLGQLEGRASELAVRSALGANRKRLAQPLLVEALLLGLVAGAVGALGAAGSFHTLAAALPLGEFSIQATFDWTLFVAAMFVAVLAVVLVVLTPSIVMFRRQHANLQSVLSQARAGGVRGGGARLERVLVVAEVALAMLIASGAALLVRSVNNLYAIDPGIQTDGVAVVDVVVGAEATSAQRQAAFAELERAFSEVPGTSSVSFAMRLPLRGNSNSFGIAVPGREEAQQPTTFFRIAGTDYARTLGLRITSGRWFATTDRPDSNEMFIVVNQALANEYFPGLDPVGRLVAGGFRRNQRIIGVVNDVSEGTLQDGVKPTRYFSTSQAWMGSNASFVVKMRNVSHAESALDNLREIVAQRTPELAVERTTTLRRVLDTAVGPARQIMTLLSLLSGLALILGAVGIYGVLAHFANRRKRDWAIRVALGLPGTRVISHIVGQGAVLILAGVVAGGVATMVLSRFLSTMLYGVSGVDVRAFAGASAAVLVTGLVAAFIPARRAGSVDPALVLRDR